MIVAVGFYTLIATMLGAAVLCFVMVGRIVMEGVRENRAFVKADDGQRHTVCLQRTAALEREIYGQVMSDSVGDQAPPLDPDMDLISGTFDRATDHGPQLRNRYHPPPPRGRGCASRGGYMSGPHSAEELRPPFMSVHGNPQLRNWSKPNHGGIPVSQDWVRTETVSGWPWPWPGNMIRRIVGEPNPGYFYTPFPDQDRPDGLEWLRSELRRANLPDPMKDERR